MVVDLPYTVIWLLLSNCNTLGIGWLATAGCILNVVSAYTFLVAKSGKQNPSESIV